MSIEIQKNLFTYKDLSQIVNRLLKLDKELDEMLSVYQTNDRRDEIEEIRVYCNPVYLLQGLLACLYFEDEDDPVEVSSDMRSIALEDEFYKCETTDWLIDSLAGKPNPNPYANKPHPWTKIDELKKYPEEIYFCIESVMSSYFTLTGIEEDRLPGHIKQAINKPTKLLSISERNELSRYLHDYNNFFTIHDSGDIGSYEWE